MREDKRRPEVQAKMLERMIRAYGKRVGADDPDALAGMLALEDALSEAIESAVKALKAQGFYWTEIGKAVGLSKQAAQQRWGAFPERPCTACGQSITDTFGTIDRRDYCLRCHGRAMIQIHP